MNAKTTEDMYFDSNFDEYIVMLSSKNLIDYDDLKQEIFLDITEAGERTRTQCFLIADKVAKRVKRRQMQEDASSLDDILETESMAASRSIFYREPRMPWYHDGTRLSKRDERVVDLIGIMQPDTTIDIFEGKVILNGAGA